MADGREIFGQTHTSEIFVWNNPFLKIHYNDIDNPLISSSGAIDDYTLNYFHENRNFKNYYSDKCLNITNLQPTLTTNKGIRFYKASSRKPLKDNDLINVFNDGPKEFQL